MNTIKIYLTESGRIADLQKDFPLYQGQFQNKLLNVFVPTSILAPIFTSSGAVSADYVASTSTKIGMTYTARDGSIKTSKNYYMRYLKTLMYKGVEYALYERKLPKEFTFYAGQGENSPVLIINVVNIEQQSGDTPPLVLSVITSQTCHLDVMQSTFLDRDELDEPSELENLNAQVQALNALMPKKQDKEDESIALEQAPAEKTVVGAINELGGLVKTAQSSADTAQQTAETAQTTADNATTLANNAVATANAIAGTANQAMTIAEQAKTIATNSVYSVSFEDIQSAVTALNGYDNAYFKVGNSIFLKQKDVPDMWVYAVASEYVEYTYTTDDDFVNALLLGTVQVGYYVLANLESTGDYDVLKNKPIINQDLSADGFTPVENTYYRHTGTTSETYTNGVIYFYNGTAYKAIDGAGGEVPTSLPATGAKITGSLPTSGWTTIGRTLWSGTATFTSSWASIGTYTGNKDDITSIVATIDGENITLPRISQTTTANQYSDGSKYVGLYTSGNEIKIAYFSGSTGVLTNLKANDVSSQIYTISDTAIKTNSTVSMYLNSADEVRAYSKTDGSVVVEMDSVPTVAIPYTLQVVETSAEGAFEIVNSYLPTIPETPTALPQTAGALKSGNLPTSGWTATVLPLWEGNFVTSKHSGESIILPPNSLDFNKLKQYTNKTEWQICIDYSSTGITYKTPLYANLYSSGLEIGDNAKKFIIKPDGSLYAYNNDSSTVYFKGLKCLANSQYTFAISDTSITVNSDILMELTDDGGVKAYSMEAGKITVIRDTVPTSPIPFTYKVKQTNASGQFTVINHYTPEIPETPTTTTLYEDSTGAATVTLSETINNGDIVRIKTNNGNVDHYYIGVAWNRAITVTESLMVTDESDVTVGTGINIYSLRFNIQDTSLILFHYFKTNITTAGAVTISNEKANVVIRKVERIHT